MGSGDWNDGMNLVGSEGAAKASGWDGFLSTVLESFARVLDRRESAHTSSPHGAHPPRSCRIAGAIQLGRRLVCARLLRQRLALGLARQSGGSNRFPAQSWAVISQAADAARARRAMESAQRYLVDQNGRMVLLFTPPFDHSEPHPGYIMGYPPGLRENGGQYTHGALWLAMAWPGWVTETAPSNF